MENVGKKRSRPALAETERDNIRDGTLEGLDAAAREGKHGGRPPVITDDMLHTVMRRHACDGLPAIVRPGPPTCSTPISPS